MASKRRMKKTQKMQLGEFLLMSKPVSLTPPLIVPPTPFTLPTLDPEVSSSAEEETSLAHLETDFPIYFSYEKYGNMQNQEARLDEKKPTPVYRDLDSYAKEGQELLLALRRYHHKQADNWHNHNKALKDKKLSTDQVLRLNVAEENNAKLREDWLRKEMDTKFADLSPDDLRYIQHEFAEYRLRGSKGEGYHSRPISSQHFCKRENWCMFQKHFQYCDLLHTEDLQAGDVIFSELTPDDYDDSTQTCYAMWDADVRRTWRDNVLLIGPIAGTELGESKQQKRPLLKETLSWHGSRWAFGYSFDVTKRARLVCRFTAVQQACRQVYQCDVQMHHICTMARLHRKDGACYQYPTRYLDLFLAGVLDTKIVQFICNQEKECVGIDVRTTIPQATFIKWIEEINLTKASFPDYCDVLCFRHSFFPEHENQTTLSLSEWKKIHDCVDFLLHNKFNPKKPEDLPDHLVLEPLITSEKVPLYYFASYRVAPIVLHCFMFGGNTSTIGQEDTLETWKARECKP